MSEFEGSYQHFENGNLEEMTSDLSSHASEKAGLAITRTSRLK
jgi:hypothetical protein